MNLIELLPEFYKKNETMLLLQNILSKRKDELNSFLKDEFMQIFPTLATDELKRWEKILDIETDINVDLDSRRERICSKLVGNETTTKEAIKDMIKIFTNGDVDIIEENSKYHFKIKFVNIIGLPKRLDSVRKAIEDLKPAHLSYEFVFLYNTNKNLTKSTHERLKKYKHLSLRNEVING